MRGKPERVAHHDHRTGRTAPAARAAVAHSGRHGAVAAIAPVAEQHPTAATVATGDPRGERIAAVAAVTDPARRAPVAAVETVSAVADQAAVAAVAGSAGAGARIAGEAVAVSEQHPGVRVVGGAVPDEGPDEPGDRVVALVVGAHRGGGRRRRDRALWERDGQRRAAVRGHGRTLQVAGFPCGPCLSG